MLALKEGLQVYGVAHKRCSHFCKDLSLGEVCDGDPWFGNQRIEDAQTSGSFFKGAQAAVPGIRYPSRIPEP